MKLRTVFCDQAYFFPAVLCRKSYTRSIAAEPKLQGKRLRIFLRGLKIRWFRWTVQRTTFREGCCARKRACEMSSAQPP
eukprot:1197742-Rhodomonas_salina.1